LIIALRSGDIKDNIDINFSTTFFANILPSLKSSVNKFDILPRIDIKIINSFTIPEYASTGLPRYDCNKESFSSNC
jgi:hypothetical protein